jgi:hypothetical protein
MGDDGADKEQKSNKRTWNWGGGLALAAALLVTAIWVVYALGIAIPMIWRCSGNWGFVSIFGWPEVKPAFSACMDLNAFGDFLAGAFAPLAFLWLLITVLYQRADLAETRRAFDIQLEEARLQSQALKADLAFSRARGLKDQIETMLDLLRPLAEHAVQRRSDATNTAFFSGVGRTLAQDINTVVECLREGGIANNDVSGRRARSAGTGMLQHLPALKALRVSVASDADNAALFNNCHLPQITEALEALDEFQRAPN